MAEKCALHLGVKVKGGEEQNPSSMSSSVEYPGSHDLGCRCW